MEKEFKVSEVDPTILKYFFYGLIVGGIIVAIFALFYMLNEYNSYKGFCDSVPGELHFNVSSWEVHYYCNDREIMRYEDGLSFDRKDIQNILKNP